VIRLARARAVQRERTRKPDALALAARELGHVAAGSHSIALARDAFQRTTGKRFLAFAEL
jgi:hypothetical protein